MVKPIQQLALGFPTCIFAVAGLSVAISHQPPSSIAGFLLSFIFPLLSLAFGAMFIVAFNRCLLLPSHPVARFVSPILFAAALVACSLLIGTRLAALFHQGVSSRRTDPTFA
jgi:hypothetical protein